LNVSDKEFQQCGKIITPRHGDLRIRSDPKSKVLKDGIYVVSKHLENKWILSIYRDRCLGTNEIEIAVDPLAMANLGNDPSMLENVRAWLMQQRAQLENQPARKRITNTKVSSFSLGFTLVGAQEFLRRIAKELEWPFPTWRMDTVDQRAKVQREAAVAYMMAMAFQAAAASGTQRLEVAKNKEVRFKSTELFQAHIELLLQEPVCAITKLPLDLSFEDKELAPSLDRRDSNRHYEPGNLQIVARFVNRWKSDDDQANFERLLALVRNYPGSAV
jgi:hypothetical protein